MGEQVTLDVTAAEAALRFLRDQEAGLPPDALAPRWRAVVDSPAYRAWLKVASHDPEGVLAYLRDGAPGHDVPADAPDAARSVISGFSEGVGRIPELTARLAEARALPVTEAAGRAKTMLPPDCPLEARVFVLLSGDHQGMATDDGEVTLDLAVIPPVPAAGWFGPLLAHELHHVGSAWCWRRDPAAAAVGAPLALRVLHRLCEEGVANAYFSPPDVEWMRDLADAETLASVGLTEGNLRMLEQNLAEGRARLPALVADLDRALQSLLSGQPTEDAAEYARLISWSHGDLAIPISHFLGAAMVSAIREHAGDQAVIACVSALRRFVPAYQEAAPAAGLPRLGEGTVAAIERMWG